MPSQMLQRWRQPYGDSANLKLSDKNKARFEGQSKQPLILYERTRANQKVYYQPT